MGLIRLAMSLASEMGNNQSRQDYHEPVPNQTANNYYGDNRYGTYQPEPLSRQYQSPYTYQTKRERRADRRLARAEYRVERAEAMNPFGTRRGCCETRRACAPPMGYREPQYSNEGYYGQQPPTGYREPQYVGEEYRGGYVEEPRREMPAQSFTRNVRGETQVQHGPQEAGFVDVKDKEAPPPAYDTVTRG